ncbi:MAG: helix-turn-helix transcriptional regulator [Labilithrix sp.]|nr:helix-turn-helix transcriptional regulator [Labilithrix sp.]MCW5815094.1 helix-turn-helix transcriptional regulator [Labilithrix sp.]
MGGKHARKSRGTMLRELTALLHRGVVSDGDVEELLVLYSGALGMRGMVVGQYGFHSFSAQRDVPDSWPEEHTRHRDQDPSGPFLQQMPAGTPYVVSEHLTPAIVALPIYAAFSRAEIRDALIFRFPTAFRDDIFVATYRLEGMPLVSSEDVTLARLLYPHCAGALSAKSAVLALEHQRSGASARPLTDGEAHVGFPRLDVMLSARARRTFMRELGPLTASGWSRVERMVAKAATTFFHGQVGSRSRLLLPTLRVEFAWVPPVKGESRRALVLFFREPPPHGKLTLAVSELLSPRQRQIAELAANGADNVAIASRVGISRETVRSHLHEAFRRLGVSSRTELAAFLTVSSTDELA